MTTSIEESFANWLSNLNFVRQLGKVFVVGSPKSGTTWLQDLLHAHPEMVVNGEGRFTWRLLPVLQQAFSVFNKDQREHSPKAITVLRDCDLAMTARAIMDGQLSRYIVESGKDHTRIKIIGDKTPQHCLSMSALRQLYPSAKFIHITRDPRDVAVSASFHLGKSGDKSMPDYLRYFATEVWPTNVDAAVKFTQACPAQVLQIRYEDLHADELFTLKRCFEFLGVDSSADTIAQCMQAASFEKQTGGRQRGQADPTSFHRNGMVGDWVNHMSAELANEICEKIQPLMRSVGYDPTITRCYVQRAAA